MIHPKNQLHIRLPVQSPSICLWTLLYVIGRNDPSDSRAKRSTNQPAHTICLRQLRVNHDKVLFCQFQLIVTSRSMREQHSIQLKKVRHVQSESIKIQEVEGMVVTILGHMFPPVGCQSDRWTFSAVNLQLCHSTNSVRVRQCWSFNLLASWLESQTCSDCWTVV